jgi:preprotein translocase subunit SecE
MTNDQMTAGDKKGGFGSFIAETRREIGKVTWPTRKEIMTTTILIVVFALVAGVFFLIVDSILGRVVSYILGMNS